MLTRREKQRLRHAMLVAVILIAAWHVPQTHDEMITILEWAVVLGSISALVYLAGMAFIFVGRDNTSRPKKRRAHHKRP